MVVLHGNLGLITRLSRYVYATMAKPEKELISFVGCKLLLYLEVITLVYSLLLQQNTPGWTLYKVVCRSQFSGV